MSLPVSTIAEMNPPIYGFDIETDTSIDGFDPSVSRIVAASVVGESFAHVSQGDEREILTDIHRLLGELPTGVIATWNGSAFDLPFWHTRCEQHHLHSDLSLILDSSIVLRGGPMPGHQGAYQASWRGHRHLDAYRVYRGDLGRALPVSCALKPLARFVGLDVVEVDRAQIHQLSKDELASYVASDAHLTRLLVNKRLPTILGAVDRLTVANYEAEPS